MAVRIEFWTRAAAPRDRARARDCDGAASGEPLDGLFNAFDAVSSRRRAPRGAAALLRLEALSLAALSLAALSLGACGRSSVFVHKPEPGDMPAARVGRDVIWRSDVRREAVAQGAIGEGETLSPSSEPYRRLLDQVIDQKLLAAEAAREGIDKDPVVRRRLQAAHDKLLGDVLVESVVDRAVNESAVRALYAEQQRLAHVAEEIRARQIVSATPERAEDVKRLLAAGASFEALAMQRSTDAATRFNGGDLGYFSLSAMPEAYSGALKDAKPGTVVGPFHTDAGFVVARIEDRRAEQPLSLDEARPQIVRFLTYDEIRTLLSRLRGAAQIQILNPPTAPGGADSAAPAGSAPATAGSPPGAGVHPPEGLRRLSSAPDVRKGRT